MIESQSNPKIKSVSRLLNKKRDRYGSRTFVCEGKRIVSDIPRNAIKELFISESRADELSAFFYNPKEGEVPIEIVSDAVMKKLSDTQHPQGILAVVGMPEYSREDILGQGRDRTEAGKKASEKESVPLILVLDGVSDPGNLGTIFRVAEAAGVTGLILSEGTTDVFAPKVVRATMGSIFRMPFVIEADIAEAIGRLRERGISVYAATLAGKGLYDFSDGELARPTAFVLGNEAHGVSEEAIAACDGAVTIPMQSSALESLNVAMAAGLLAYEVLRQRTG